MNVTSTFLAGVKIIEPMIFEDQRGFFLESYKESEFLKNDINFKFVQDNRSRSCEKVLRGLHFQIKRPQGKLVSCTSGEIFDVVADINPKSETYGKYLSIRLSGENNKQLFVPPGYAHGFCVLSKTADIFYKCTEYYDPQDEGGVRWDDPLLNIKWPFQDPILSNKDKEYRFLKK